MKKHACCTSFALLGGLMLWLVAGPAWSMWIDLNGTVITDNGGGDTNPAADIIDFSETITVPWASGGSSTYDASGTLQLVGTGGAQSSSKSYLLVLTDLSIEALAMTGVATQVVGTLSFGANFPNGDSLGLPVTGTGSLDGYWTRNGDTSTPASVSDGSITLYAGILFTGTVIDPYGTPTTYLDQPLAYTDPLPSLGVSSNDGTSFGPVSWSGNNGFAVGDEYFGFTISSGSATGLHGQLGFILEDIGDGFYLPGSVNIEASTVPLPPAAWLLGGGLAGLLAAGRRPGRRRDSMGCSDSIATERID